MGASRRKVLAAKRLRRIGTRAQDSQAEFVGGNFLGNSPGNHRDACWCQRAECGADTDADGKHGIAKNGGSREITGKRGMVHSMTP